MRIIGGIYKSRQLLQPNVSLIRPTADRVRETLFNILMHGQRVGDWSLSGSYILDAFCGSGALGLEALSRGAAHTIFIDNNSHALNSACHNIKILKVEAQTTVLKSDVLTPPMAFKKCDIIFLDPPYRRGLIPLAIQALEKMGWLDPQTIMIAEIAAEETLERPLSKHVYLDRLCGPARLIFFRII